MAQQWLEVCFLASGEIVAALDGEEFEGKPAQTLKEALAARVGIPRFRQRLLLEGASHEILDDEVFSSVPSRVQLLLVNYLPPDAEQDEAMINACEENDPHVLNQLLRGPRNPNVQDADGQTALAIAAAKGHVDIAQLLLEGGAAPDALSTVTLGPRVPHGTTRGRPVHRLGRGLCTFIDGVRPLLIALWHGHLGIARLLIEAGARQDLYSAASVHAAVQSGNVDLVRLLLEAGASPNLATEDGTTPLLAAVRQGRVAIVRLLLEAGAAPDQARNDRETPLFIATFLGHLGIARFLLEAGAASNPVRKDGATPLFIAARQGHFDIARLLLESGADLGMARDFASKNGYHGAVAHLEQLEMAG